MTFNPNGEKVLEGLCSQGLDLGKADSDEALDVLSMLGEYRIDDYLKAIKAWEQAPCISLDAIVATIQLDESLSNFAFALLGPTEIVLRSALALESAGLNELVEAYCAKTDSGKEEVAQRFEANPQDLEHWLPRIAVLSSACVHRERLYANTLDDQVPTSQGSGVGSAGFFDLLAILFKLHDSVRPLEKGSIRWELRCIAERYPNADLRPLGFPENWLEILDIPSRKPANAPMQKPAPRARGRKGGRPAKNAEAIEKALFLYDMRTASIQEISRKTGVATTTLYKYIHLREEKTDEA